MKITKKQIDRYSRQIILKKVGIIGQKKLLESKVLIIGAGGLGSPIAIYLAAVGIGHIGIVDKDKVEISNLNRQIIFENKDIKKRKSVTAVLKIKKINPDIKVDHYSKTLGRENIHKIANKYNLIILASAEEECSGNHGISYVIPKLPNISFGIIGEPTLMKMAVAEKGLVVFDFTKDNFLPLSEPPIILIFL